MTVFYCEGFETYGTSGETNANIRLRVNATDKTQFQQAGSPNDVSLIDDFETVGLALQLGDLKISTGDFIRIEYPDGSDRFDDYRVSANGSVQVICLGFRLYVPSSITTASDMTLWNMMTSSTGTQSALKIASNLTDLILEPQSGSNTTVSSALTPGAWNYIELEVKATNSANGGYMKIFVDGSEVADITSQSIISATFFTVWGQRVGIQSSSNQTLGENFAIDDIYMMEIDGVTHTEPLGPSRVLLLSPSGEATPNDWTPSSGSDNTALIDERNWDTADYVEASTTGDDDHYSLDTLSADTVHGLSVNVVCQATDGTPDLHIGFDDGGTSDEEDMGTIGTGSVVQKRMFFNTAPAASWDVSEVNSIEATQRMTE